MDYNNELIKIRLEEQQLHRQAEIDGFTYDNINKKFIKQDEKIYVIHIAINTIDGGESLGHFEIYDKVFQVDEQFALNSSKINNLSDFMDNVLCARNWDKDFIRCNVFEQVELSNWFYCDIERSVYKDYENIITFRFAYNDHMMGNVTIMKCKSEVLRTHKSIYHYSKSYVMD